MTNSHTPAWIIMSTWIASAALHGALFLALTGFLPALAPMAMDPGPGAQALRSDSGILIESVIIVSDAHDLATLPEAVDPEPDLVQQPAETAALEPAGSSEPLPEKSEEEALPQSESPQLISSQDRVAVASISDLHGTASKQRGGEIDEVSAYLRRLRETLERHTINPHSDVAGEVVLRVTIAPSGKVTSRNVLESSGSQALDQAALASLDRVASLPALPAGVGQTPFELAIPFKFSVR
jgi:TonB family protein